MSDDAPSRDAILAGIDLSGVELLCLDVFDTLVVRRGGPPESVFRAVARAARDLGVIDPAITDDAFVLMRRRAEAEARAERVGDGDIRLADIHRRLRPGGGELAALEIRAEREAIVADPRVLAFARRARGLGIRVFLLSDMYLPATEIAAALEAAGIRRGVEYERLFVSNEEGATKVGGGLFRLALAAWGGDPARATHVGDDPLGDLEGARIAGIRAVLRRPAARLEAIEAREARLGVRLDGPAAAARRVAGTLDPGEFDPFFFDVGRFILGPVAVHFARWALRDARARGIRRIAPLMREGGLLAELMNREIARRGWDQVARPLHVSRAALLLPSLDGFGPEVLETLATGSVFRTVADLFRLLKAGPIPEAAAGEADRPSLDLFAGSGPARRALVDHLLAPDLRRRIADRILSARETARAHLRRELGPVDEPVALVDVGARGTLFRRLAAVEPEREARGYLFYAVPDALRLIADGFKLSVHMPLDAPHLERARILYRAPQVLEILLNGEADTTIGYRRRDDGEAVPVTEPSGVPETQRAALRACRAGILAHAGAVELLDGGSSGETDGGALLGVALAAAHLPTREEAERFGALVYDLNDASGRDLRLCDPAARAIVDRLCASTPPSMWLGGALQTRPGEVPWPQGALALERPGHIEDAIDGARVDFGHRAIARALVRAVLADGGTRIRVCAAGGLGGMGPSLIDAAREAGLVPVAYADLLVPEANLPGVPTVPLDRIARTGDGDLVVISVGHAPAILDALRRAVAAGAPAVRCRWFDGTGSRAVRLTPPETP